MKNTEWRAGPEMPGASGKQNHCQVELQTKVHTKAITEKVPTTAFSWLKVPTSAFSRLSHLRHYYYTTLC